MLFADKEVSELQTRMRQAEERLHTQETYHKVLTESIDTRISVLRSEQRQALTEMEDLLDKLRHQADRICKRKLRQAKAEAAEEPPAMESVSVDETTAKVLARRQARAIRSEDV